jgi:NitT/TauT family transport system substrate-binding protein
MAKAQTKGFSERVLWYSLYGAYDPAAGGNAVRVYLPYAFTPDARDLISRASEFLYSIKSINVEKLRPDAIEPQWTEEILKERGLKAPIGEVRALPDAQAPKRR